MSGLCLFAEPSWGLLVEALLHTLWQGALISVLLALALRWSRGGRRRTRYALAIASQFGVLLAGLMTWAWLEPPRYFEPMAMQQPHAALPSSSIAGSTWVPALAIGWLAGVGLMLLKTGGAVLAAHRLTRGPQVTEPTILVHELAQVRRHDYAVNLAQRFVESLLFFNPTVWWLGRQARLEREALAERAVGAANWNSDGRPSTLLERIRRVLRPDDQIKPQRVLWAGLLILLIGGPILLATFWEGTLAGISLISQKLAPPDPLGIGMPLTPDAKAFLKGTIRASSGSPSHSQIHLTHVHFTAEGGGTSMNIGPRDDFEVEMSPGENWIVTSADEYAPSLAGPFHFEIGRKFDDIPIVLDAGFPYRVRFIDLQGEPIPGVTVRAEVRCSKLGGQVASGWTTGSDGVAIIPNASNITYDFFPTLHNFSFPDDAFEATPEPGGETTFTLQRGKPASGIVVDEQGRPVADATFRILTEIDESLPHSNMSSPEEVLLAKSDSEGRFALKHLHESSTYLIQVKTQKHELGILQGVRAGATGLNAVVHPCPPVRGVVKGDLESLTFPSGATNVWLRQLVPTGFIADDRRQSNLENLTISTGFAFVAPNGEFELPLVAPIESTLQLSRATIESTRLVAHREIQVPFPVPTEPIVFQIPERSDVMRRVEIRLASVDGSPPPNGSISLLMEDDGAERKIVDRKIEFHNGRATIEARVGSNVTYSYASVPGYRTYDGVMVILPEQSEQPGQGERPEQSTQIVVVSIVSAGSIEGRFLTSDGAPIGGNANPICEIVKYPTPTPASSGPTPSDKPRMGADGRYAFPSLLKDATYVLYTNYGHTRQASIPIQLRATDPTVKFDINLPTLVPASGRVLDPEGRPAPDAPIVLQRLHPSEGMTWPPGIRTDQEGRFQFDDLGAGMEGYLVRLNYRKDFQPVTQPLQPGGPPIEIRLDRGNVLEGRLVEAVTGWPIPGVEFAAVLPGQDGRWEYQAEAATDEDGRFRFSNLPAATVRLKDYASLTWQDPQIRDFEAGKTPPVTIRATLRGSSKFKLAPPKK